MTVKFKTKIILQFCEIMGIKSNNGKEKLNICFINILIILRVAIMKFFL